MQHPEEIWKALAGRVGITINRPDFRFDPSFYARTYPDLAINDAAALQDHFDKHGRLEGRYATSYSQLRQKAPYIDPALAKLIVDPALTELVEKGHPDALHLAFELIQLGAPIDACISDFSMQAYLEWHPDIAQAGMNPLIHYLRFGTIEGGRRTLADLRTGLHTGQQQFRSELPTVMICLHEMSQTDTSAVGLDLARQAGQTHNVVVVTLRGGALLDRFLPLCCSVLITENPLREIPYVRGEVFGKIDYAILSSVECALFIHPLVAQDIPFAAYIHEYADYTFPPWKSAYTAAFANLLIFSAEHVRESWQGRLADVTFDTANDSTIIPQRPLIEGQVTEMRRIEARRTLCKALGRDLTNARIICGAGHVHWPKGTDTFVQAAQACSDVDPETVFVWIGDRRNHQDMGFGVLFDYHLRQVRADRKDGNLFFVSARALYLDVLDAADAMFLSSRLDPLPNAVFDAVQRGCQVVCFEGATGFADARYHGSDRIIRVPYADPAAAIAALLALPRKTGVWEETPGPPIKGHSLFDRIRWALQDRLGRQRSFVLGRSTFDIPLLFTKSDRDRPCVSASVRNCSAMGGVCCGVTSMMRGRR
ncbi:glycosyltransferase [Paracoccus aerius]